MTNHTSLAVAGSPPSAAEMLRSGLGFAALLGLAAAPFWPAVQNLAISTWQETDHAHGPIVVMVALVLFSLRGTPIEMRRLPEPASLVLLLGALGLGLFVRFAYVDVLQHLAVIAVAWLALATISGWRAAIYRWFPFAFLVFAAPVFDGLIPLLQQATVAVVEGGLASIGVPAVIDGSMVSVPAGSFQIERGCSGLHFFVVALAGSVLYAYVYRLPPRMGTLVVLFGTSLGVLTNWVRVFVIVWRGQQTDMQTSLVVSGHYGFGWTVFAFATLLFLAVMQAAKIHNHSSVSCQGRAGAPLQAGSAATGAAVAALLLSVATYAGIREQRRDGVAPPPAAIPARGSWVRPAAEPMDWHSGFVGARGETYAGYRRGIQFVEYYFAVYGRQEPGRKLVGFGSSIVPPGWMLDGDRFTEVVLPQPFTVRTAVVRSPTDNQWLVRYWYVVGNRATASPVVVKWWEGRQVVTELAPSGVVAVASPCAGTCEAAGRAVDDFVRDHAALLGISGGGR